MAFKFDAGQQHQLDAIAAVAAVLEGQTLVPAALVASPEAGAAIVPNTLDLSEDRFRANLAAVQADAGIPAGPDPFIVTEADLFGAAAIVRYPNISVEMETGTGKTYTYLRTALDLAARYGLRKFIIVVPSVAIREGVVTAIGQMRGHLQGLPGLPMFHAVAYDSAAPGQVRAFATSGAVEFMVMTIQAFESAKTNIRKPVEGDPPLLHTLQAVRPVLILDEPQNMKTEGRLAALASLNPSLALRYSATHVEPYGVAYRLTPVEAYRQGLVKSIEVAGATEDANANLPYLRLDRIAHEKKSLVAFVEVDTLAAKGAIKRKTVKVAPGSDLRLVTKRDEYEGFDNPRIDVHTGVAFRNGVRLTPGGEVGASREAVFESQIEYTVRRHFEKQRDLAPLGVKVLSLFFIDRVSSWTDPDGVIRRLWPTVFNRVKVEFPDYAHLDPDAVQASYFASYRTKSGTALVQDEASNEKERAAQAEQFDLIMRGKERLISFEDRRAFIFSHSALREGWDNPNVFQICTLREVASNAERRQQVGRGMRLAVNQAGERVTDPAVNRLTFVASESYERFVAKLQEEVSNQYAAAAAGPQPPNSRKRAKVKLRKEYLLKSEFRDLWCRVAQRTRYAVTIDTPRLVSEVAADLADVIVPAPRVAVQMAVVGMETGQDGASVFTPFLSATNAAVVDLCGRFPLPNMVALIEALMRDASPPMRISRRTVLAILDGLPDKAQMLLNPREFAAAAANAIRTRLRELLVSGITYTPTGEWYEQTLFAEEFEAFESNLVRSAARPVGTDSVGTQHLYECVNVDSQVERDFAEALERNACVVLYVKLPGWFTVPTPIGTYNPDWAIVWEENGAQALYLVRETKDTLDVAELRPAERLKIAAARQHFAAIGADYKLVTSTTQLPSGGV